MHNKYYISTSVENDECTAKVLLTNTNQVVYTTKAYTSKDQAIIEARTFLRKLTMSPGGAVTPETINSTVTYSSNTMPAAHTMGRTTRGPGRCCGR